MREFAERGASNRIAFFIEARLSALLLRDPDKIPGIGRKISAFAVCQRQCAECSFVSHGKAQRRLMELDVFDIIVRNKTQTHPFLAQLDTGYRIPCAYRNRRMDAVFLK